MDSVAVLRPSDRQALFTETASRRGMTSIIVEKDFWVCWTLKRLFDLPEIGQHILFKGGTTLSKVYGLIERFSEDIDISFDREWLGFVGEQDPENAPSNNKTDKLLKALQNTCSDKIKYELLPALEASFETILGPCDSEGSTWQLAWDSADPHVIYFMYPNPIRPDVSPQPDYIRPIVKIELGARSDHWPSSRHTIIPYAAETFPHLFSAPESLVTVLEVERTFWEKVTILHAEFHRGEVSTGPERVSRHYYDVYRMAEREVVETALSRLDLLERVVEHKSVFYRLCTNTQKVGIMKPRSSVYAKTMQG